MLKTCQAPPRHWKAPGGGLSLGKGPWALWWGERSLGEQRVGWRRRSVFLKSSQSTVVAVNLLQLKSRHKIFRQQKGGKRMSMVVGKVGVYRQGLTALSRSGTRSLEGLGIFRSGGCGGFGERRGVKGVKGKNDCPCYFRSFRG